MNILIAKNQLKDNGLKLFTKKDLKKFIKEFTCAHKAQDCIVSIT